MKRSLLPVAFTLLVIGAQAQKKNKTVPATNGYAITAVEKGGRGWKEVRQIDAATGETLKTIYDSKQASEPLNARTGKAIEKKEEPAQKTVTAYYYGTGGAKVTDQKKVLNLDQEVFNTPKEPARVMHRVYVYQQRFAADQPFASNSAAMAYDKKHERLYYTPMAINQLRYIDLKTGKIYFFENEPFGVVEGMADTRNQITRMAIASDGNGYALSNDANHLIRFTTGKNPEITDLGPLNDEAVNKVSVHSDRGFGGDMIADASGNLYVITANRAVFKVSIENKSAQFLGTIKGLPQGFTTNGAMAEGGSKVIIASSESTSGYYRFDLNTLQAEKVSQSADVFNASDLANGVLAFEKNKKDKKQDEVKNETAAPVVETVTAKADESEDMMTKSGIAVFPNPVTNGSINLSFKGQAAGKYQVQLLDMAGRIVASKEVNINSEAQTENFRFPELSVKGSYLVKITSEENKVNVTNKIVVQ